MIGTLLDKYEVLQKVGEGGMATVYRGRHATLGRDVAIKVLHPHLSSSARNRKRFAREARAIEHLRHENILEIFDYSGTEADECYIVTEFVKGETLGDVIQRVGTVPSEPAAAIGIAIARALDYAHKNGVLHRDLKPDNVMLRDDGTVKLMDFGIARFLDESQVTMTGALVGSPAYMSPEQAREGDLDLRSDLFSLGTLLFQLVTGHLPFQGSNPSLVLKNVIEGNRPSVTELTPTMSATLADVIERLLQVDREARFDSAASVADALAASLLETEVDTTAPTWSISAFVADPDGYRQRLDTWLRRALLDGGKRELAKGDHLAALRLWNRLLSMDENNGEVLALVQGLHAAEPPAATGRPSRSVAPILLGIGAIATSALLVLGWISLGSQPSVEIPPETPANPPAAAMIEPSRTAITIQPILRADPPIAPLPTPTAGDPTEAPPVAKVRTPRPTLPTDPPVAPIVTPAVDDRPGIVQFLVDGTTAYAKVWCDGREVGDTRGQSKVSLSPGIYRCQYKSGYIEDEEFEVTVDPGTEQKVRRAVRIAPLLLRVDNSCADDCAVRVDATSLGTVSAIGRVVRIDQPDRPHEVTVKCGDRTSSIPVAGIPVPVVCDAGSAGKP